MTELELKYGCNPNQKPARIFMEAGELPLEVLNGRPGYINFMDALNSWQLVKALKQATGLPAAASFKHVSPAGAALGLPLSDVERSSYFAPEGELSPIACAYIRARGTDRLCSFGDWAALSDTCDGDTARFLALEVSDGVMVARGDMGVEIPIEEIPALQKRMIKMAVSQGKHVITATQMLESMIKNPRPTRAEVTDIANAIYDGTTAIMLSGESAAGKYPVEAVETMARIAECAEKELNYRGRMDELALKGNPDTTTAISYATCTTAMDLHASAIITVTMSGFTATKVAKYKPSCPIISCSVNSRVCKQLNLLWGCQPLLLPEKDDTEELFDAAVEEAKKAGYIKPGELVVITAGVPLGKSGTTNMIRVVEVK